MSGPTLLRTEPLKAAWTQIPNALGGLWRACLPDMKGGDVARALTINLVGVATIDDAAMLREAAERLLRRTPCRAFLLLLDPAATTGDAELAATTRCQGDLRDIVLETITIRVQPSALDQMPGLVRPLLVNDLANHLFWATAWPTQTGALDALANLCDHVVVDSRRFTEPPRDLQRVAERRAAGEQLTDLTWLRLRPWRRALAECFERCGGLGNAEATVRGHIRHGKKGTAAAILLADWLEERLGARLSLDGRGDQPTSGPDQVALDIGSAQFELSVLGQQIQCHVTTQEHCYLPFSVPIAKGSDGDLLAAAIDMD